MPVRADGWRCVSALPPCEQLCPDLCGSAASAPAGWVSKKIRELMGEEEKSFCEFIMQKARSHAAQRNIAQRSTAQPLHLPCSASSTVAAPLLPVSRVAACIWVLPCQRCSLLKPAPHPHTRAPRPEPPPATLPSTRTQVAAHISAQGMLEALQDVLDEDSPSFTTKLYQVLIYESEKLALAGGGV